MKKNVPHQFDLFSKITPINTVIIVPDKNIPLELYREFYHLAYFMELMERLPNGMVLWDENKESFYNINLIDVEYELFKKGIIEVEFELPEKFVRQFEE